MQKVTMHENRGFEENIEDFEIDEMVSTYREFMNLSRRDKEETNFNSINESKKSKVMMEKKGVFG